MNEEIKIEDIIESLRACENGCSSKCVCRTIGFASDCCNNLKLLAADRLEWLATENELLHGALASCGAPKNTESKENDA